MARAKAATLILCTLLALAVLAGIAAVAGLSLAQTPPPEATTQDADNSPTDDTPPADETPPDEVPPAQPAAVDTTAVNSLLVKTDQGQLTADEHAQLVNGLDGLVSSALDTTELLRLAQWSGKSLAAEEKANLRGKILDRLAGTAEKAGALTVADARQATVVFDVLGGPGEKGKLAVAWMGASETWKTAGPEPLVRFLTGLNLGKPDDAAKPRTALVDHVWTTYLCPQADAGKATGPEYAELAIQTHRFLSAERAKELSKFMVARLSEPKTAAQLSIADIKKVRQTLGSLHNQLDAADVIAAWVVGWANRPTPAAPGDGIAANNAAMAPLPAPSPGDIAFLCDQLRPKEGLAGPKAAIAALVEQARSRKLLNDPEAIIANDAGQWPAMARAFRNYITEAEQKGVIEQVKKLFLEDRQRTAKLTGGQLADLAEMCGYYWRADLAGQVALIWLAANDLSKLSADQLSLVAGALNSARAADVAAKKASLGDLVWTAYLSREEFLTKTSLEELTGFVKNVSSALTPEQKARAADALLRRFAPDAAVLSKLSVSDAIRLAQVLGALGKAQAAGDLAVRWIAAGDGWKEAGPHEQEMLAGILKGGGSEETSAKAAEWAASVYQQQLAALKGGAPETFTLTRLAAFMQQMGMNGKGKAHPEFAAALAAAFKADAPVLYGDDHRVLALPLGSQEDWRTLEGVLVNEDGAPRPGPAKVLAWAYKHYDTLANWQLALDARLADTAVTGDKRADWLVVRAFAADPANAEHGVKPIQDVLTEALAAAASDAAKLRILRLLVSGAMVQKQFDQAENLANTLAASLNADDSKTAAAGILRGIRASRIQALTREVEDLGIHAAIRDRLALQNADKPVVKKSLEDQAAEVRQKQAEAQKRLDQLKGQ